MSLRDKILATDDIRKKIVNVPEWGIDVEVRGMTGAGRTTILENAVDPATGQVDLRIMYPAIVIASCFDPETGEQIFTPEDKDLLLAKSATALDRLAQEGMQVGGLTNDEVEQAGKQFPAVSES